MGEKCGKCKFDINNSIALHCNGLCKKSFHPECMNITSYESKFINKSKNTMWFCDNCILAFEKFFEVKLEIEQFKCEINKKIEDIYNIVNTSSNDSNMNYDNLNNRANTETTGEAVIVNPEVQECKVVKEVEEETLNTTKLDEVGITEMKDIKGEILRSGKSRKKIKKLKNEAEMNLKKNYDVKTPEQKNVHIKIVDLVADVVDPDTLKNCILKQNAFLNNKCSFLKVKAVKRMKTKYMAIVECDPLSAELMIKQKKINIGRSTCRVYEYIPDFRYRDYDHKAESRKKEERCPNHADILGYKTIRYSTPASTEPKTCNQCKEVIKGGVLTALGKSWHPDHFVCNECKKPITESKFHTSDDQPYCTPCHIKLFAKTCHACDEPILDKCVQAMGANWHEDHFLCNDCKSKLIGTQFMDVGGVPYCQKCYISKHADRCKGCGKPIPDKAIVALDAKWHQMCFRCSRCSKPIMKDQSFQVEGGKPHCVKC